MASNQILYLLSSTQEPYIKDILDILALPSDSRYRFRYEFMWLPSELQTQDKLEGLKNNEALIVHVHSKLVEKDGVLTLPILEFIPIRKAIIVDAKIMGGFVIFNFRLGDYVKYSEPFHRGSNKLSPFSAELKSKAPADSRDFVKSLAFFADTLTVSWVKDSIASPTDEVIVNWYNVVSYIGRLDAHKKSKSVFTKLLEITNITDGKHIGPEDFSHDLHGFRLKTSATYRIKLLQRYLVEEKMSPTFKIEITTNSGDINLIKGQALAQGSYDVLDYIISVANVISSRESFLYIRPDEIGDKSFMVSSSLHFVKIVPSPRKIALVFGSIIGGITLAAISSMVAEATQISQLAIILSLAGAITSAVSAPFFPKS